MTLFFSISVFGEKQCFNYLNNLESQTQSEDLFAPSTYSTDDTVTWDQLVEIFVETKRYDLTNLAPKELLDDEPDPRNKRLNIEPSQILGPAFRKLNQYKPAYVSYGFLVSLKIADTYKTFQIIFGIHKENNKIFVFALTEPNKRSQISYFDHVAEYNTAVMGNSEPEYYTIRGFYKGITTLKVTPAMEYKIRTRHKIDIYDVVEPLHVGRIKGRFTASIINGVVSDKNGFVFVKSDSGTEIKVVLEVIIENGEKIFLLKSAYNPE